MHEAEYYIYFKVPVQILIYQTSREIQKEKKRYKIEI